MSILTLLFCSFFPIPSNTVDTPLVSSFLFLLTVFNFSLISFYLHWIHCPSLFLLPFLSFSVHLSFFLSINSSVYDSPLLGFMHCPLLISYPRPCFPIPPFLSSYSFPFNLPHPETTPSTCSSFSFPLFLSLQKLLEPSRGRNSQWTKGYSIV